MRYTALKIISAGALAVALLTGSPQAKEAPKEAVPPVWALEILQKDFPFIGNDIPERNIPEERQKELKEAQKLRIAQIKEEQERRRLEELERQRKAEEERRARESADAGTAAQFTAYYAYHDQMQGGGITATGYNLYNSIYYQGYRVLAADKSIPFYSILELNIEGYGKIRGIVLDRGGRIKGNLIDVAFPDRGSCMEFGRRTGTYKIIRLGKG